MEMKQLIENIQEGHAILFAGAGFSYKAKNIHGETPSAKKLKEELLSDLDLPLNSEHNLEIISDFYRNKKSPTDLVNKLKECFNVVKIMDFHEKIINMPWRRIYTTNYDQVIELASKKSLKPIILSDDFDDESKKSICIHINGYIERLNEKKLDNEFKLTDKSYSCDTLIGNPWFEFMVNDFSSASVIVVIGYSMQYDIDIKRLFSSPNISHKVVFIDSPTIDEISKEFLKNYGVCFSIGIEGFSKELDKVLLDYVPVTSDFTFRCFKYSYHNVQTVDTPSYEEIVNLYVEGNLDKKLFKKNRAGEYEYILERNATKIFFNSWSNKKCFITISNLGNGKSVFLSIIENELMNMDVKVFRFRHRYTELDEEIEQICTEKKRCVVIIDNYPGHMDILYKFTQYGHNNITFLLSARNGVNLLFCKQLEKALRISSNDIFPLYVNEIKSNEIDRLADILEKNSLLNDKIKGKAGVDEIKKFIITDCESKFSNVLLELFNSSNIKRKLVKLYRKLESTEDSKIKEVVIFSLLKNISNFDLNFYQILDLFSADYLAFKTNENEFVSEIFGTNENYLVSVRSSVISKELIRNVINMKDIIDTMTKAFLVADKKNKDRTYLELQKSMVSHSQFIFFTEMNNDSEKFLLIEKFYDNIRNTNFAKHNPFYWEQFASAYIDMKKYELVKKCIDTALVEAKKISGFVPFQIKTVQGRYIVEKCYDSLLKGEFSADEAINSIKSATDAIVMYYRHPENNLYYVFKVVQFYPKIFDLIKNDLTSKNLSVFIENSTIMSKRMDNYLSDNDEIQYKEKVKTWQKNINLSINLAIDMKKNIENGN